VISRRIYAVRRGTSEKAIANGRIVNAVLEDGTIDAGKADELLASSTVAGVHVSTTLANARRRKAAASAALIEDEIADMEESLCPVAAVIEAEDIVWTYAKRRFMANVLPCSERIARQPAEVVFRILMDAVDRALHEISNTEIKRKSSRKPKPRKAKAKPLADMTADALAILRMELLARRLELRRAVKRGELVAPDEFSRPFYDEVGRVRTNMLSLPAKWAPLVGNKTSKQVREQLGDEMDDIFEMNTGLRGLL